MIKPKLIIILMVFTGSFLKAQELPLYSQYFFNKYLVNPAIAGSEGYTAVSLTAREQWVGFKGTPKMHSISMESRILRNSFISKDVSVRRKKRLSSRSGRVGYGAHLYNDKNGLVGRTGLEGTYTYHIPFQEGQLSFGLTGMLYQFRVAKDEVILPDDVPDQLVDGSKNSLYIPDANFGVYYMQREFYGGISVMQILNSNVQFGEKTAGDYNFARQYNILGGYRYPINDNFELEGSLLLRIPERQKFQMDFHAKVTYLESYWAGMAFRNGGAFIIFAGGRFDRYYLGYAFDYNFGEIMRHTYGSHEIMAAVKFGDSARRYKWLNTY